MRKCIPFLAGIALFAVIWPYQHDMYVGALHTVICVILNGASCLLFAAMLFQKLQGVSWRENRGIYLWFLLLSGIGHALFVFMNWGSWVCLGISALALILLLTEKR